MEVVTKELLKDPRSGPLSRPLFRMFGATGGESLRGKNPSPLFVIGSPWFTRNTIPYPTPRLLLYLFRLPFTHQCPICTSASPRFLLDDFSLGPRSLHFPTCLRVPFRGSVFPRFPQSPGPRGTRSTHTSLPPVSSPPTTSRHLQYHPP